MICLEHDTENCADCAIGAMDLYYEDIAQAEANAWLERNRDLIIRAYITGDVTLLNEAT